MLLTQDELQKHACENDVSKYEDLLAIYRHSNEVME